MHRSIATIYSGLRAAGVEEVVVIVLVVLELQDEAADGDDSR